MDHSQRKDPEVNNTELVIGALLGTVDGKQIDISNSFPMTLKASKNPEGSNKAIEYIFDQEYMKKMLNFHRKVNESESLLGVYISSTDLNKEAMVIFSYI